MSTSTTHTLITTFGSMVTRAWRLLVNRRQVNRLHHLTDAQLEDIGLTRSDLRCAKQVSLFTDPSHVLSEWARERSLEKRALASAQLPKASAKTEAHKSGPMSCPDHRLAA
ncbi:DUF1127 domain-containing protein [Roseibium algae]|uniref:DUF1127 domain-containing protein n=1 Tax=Roseibium algae TaxID=3123038 RepID=A0ABU8THG6_9HYPH